MLQINAAELPSVQMLVAGPSCAPFAATGNRLAWATSAHLLLRLRRTNVSGLGDKPKGKRKSPLDEVLEGLHNGLKGWVIVAWKLNSCEFGVPQTRPRYYICGRKASAFE
eukprot:9469381-Pyramimonas_sp.AAC.1